MKKVLLFVSGCALLSMGSYAQTLKEGYITWPESSSLHTYVNSWSKASPNSITINGSAWEDQNFFISRVKIKPYISNTATQVHSRITPENDKKLLFWVPVGNVRINNVATGSLPNGAFDSEVFSLWPYVTYYGDWISPYGWIPGGFADAAHKHGTAVAGQASIPNATIGTDWKNCLTGIANMQSSDATVKNLGDFLAYHGVDGLGYNSEFGGGSSFIGNLSKLHGKLMNYMHNTLGNTKFENPWYTGTNSNGNIDFTSALTSANKDIFGTADEPRTSLFVNYEWVSYLSTTASVLPGTGRDGRDLYMGMNMQAGTKRSNEWTTHQTTNYSIGLWGAHDFNYIWSGRSGEGSRDTQKQAYYQKRLEQWFTNGNRNPADAIDVFETTSLAPSEDWFGMSQFMSARSTLGWDLSVEPFVTYFNLGNGRFFNWKGERQNDNEWYNLGAQDYMPTWRFWWSNKLLSGEKSDVNANGLKSEFTWDDAYMGGSCLRIYGTSANDYLHLFKTQFKLSTNDEITIRYKLLGGQADMNLILTIEGKENEAVRETNMKIFTTEDMADDGVWVEKTVKVSGTLGTPLRNKTLALVGLHFQNAENLELYLGEFSIKKAAATATPSAPIIDKAKSKVLSYNKSGVDGKIIFNMANSKDSGEPVYNTDVNTSIFKLYAQYEGGEEKLMGMTSSWAGMYFAVPADVASPQKIRFGVSAVSLDGESESDIAWTDYMSLPSYQTSDVVEIDKQVIKPGESFTVGYADPKHAAASWKIYNANNQLVAFSSGSSIEWTCDGLNEVGGYDLVVNDNTRYIYFIQVSAKDKGALPEVQSLAVNSKEEVSMASDVEFEVNEKFNLSYTGREADGTASKGLRINNQFVGGPMSDLKMSQGTSFSIAAWVKMDYPAGSSNLLGIENRGETWPRNNWGFFWLNIAGTNGSTSYGTPVPVGGIESYTFRGDGTKEFKYKFSNSVIPNNAWTHVVFTFDWNSSSAFKSEFYINGVKQVPVAVEYTSGTPTGTNDSYYSINNKANLNMSTMWFCLGGGRGSEPNFNEGVVDDVVIWNGAMTAAEVKTVMAGLNSNSLPDKVLAYWDLETEADGTHTFSSVGSVKGAKFCNFTNTATENEGQGIQTPVVPVYDAGTPFIDGTGFPVVTKPTWNARKIASISDATGNDRSGSAKISFPRAGDYTVSLSLDNAYGTHTMEYPVFSIIEETNAIEGIEGDGGNTNIYTVNRTLFVDFAADGDYTVNVYSTNGQLVGKNAQRILAGQNMSISLANPGVYVVNVVKDGKTLRTIKVLNK